MTAARHIFTSQRGREGRTPYAHSARVRCCSPCAEREGVIPIGLLHSEDACPMCGVAPFLGVVGTRRRMA